MFKLNAVRTAAWVPLGLLLGALNARSTQPSLEQGCWTSTKAVLLFLMVMPILLAGKFSKVANDTSNLRLPHGAVEPLPSGMGGIKAPRKLWANTKRMCILSE